MGYQTPVTNRTIASYFNLTDFDRIVSNGKYVHNLSEIFASESILWSNPAQPYTRSIANNNILLTINILLSNLERIRSIVLLTETIPGTESSIKSDYLSGMDKDVFDFEDVNYWESCMDLIWEYFGGDSLLECPTLSADETVTTIQIYVDCVRPGNYALIPQGAGVIYII